MSINKTIEWSLRWAGCKKWIGAVSSDPCKRKRVGKAHPNPSATPAYTIKTESAIANVEALIKNTEAINYFQSKEALKWNEGVCFSFNETDSLAAFKYKYFDSNKTLRLYYLKYTFLYKVITIEQIIDKIRTSKEANSEKTSSSFIIGQASYKLNSFP